MTYSYIVSELRCDACGRASAATVVTKVDVEPATVLRVGSPVDVNVSDMAFTHCLVRKPAQDEPIRFLEAWDCPACDSPEWVEVSISGGRIREVRVVGFDRGTLDRIHFVSEDVAQLYQERTGEAFHVDDAVRPDWPARLRAHLAEPAA